MFLALSKIRIGEETNIQDGTVIHVARNNASGVALPTVIGDRVTVGHMALLHACTLEDLSFVGMAATVMDGAVVRKGECPLERASQCSIALADGTSRGFVSMAPRPPLKPFQSSPPPSQSIATDKLACF